MILILLLFGYILFKVAGLWVLWHWDRLAFPENRSKKPRIVIFIVFLLAAALPIIGALLPVGRAKFALQSAGNYWLGFFLYFSFFLLLCLVLHLYPGHREGRTVPQTVARTVLLFCLLLALSVNVYGYLHAQRVVATHWEVNLSASSAATVSDHDGTTSTENGGPDDISDSTRESASDTAASCDSTGEGTVGTGTTFDSATGGSAHEMTIVFIADLHLSVDSNPDHIRDMVELINEQNPDLILIGGDIFTSSYDSVKNLQTYVKALRRLSAPCGVFAVYGNHDVSENLLGGFAVTPRSQALRDPRMTAFMKDCGFTILDDASVVIQPKMAGATSEKDNGAAGDVGPATTTGDGAACDATTARSDGQILLIGRRDKMKPGDGSQTRKSAAELMADADAMFSAGADANSSADSATDLPTGATVDSAAQSDAVSSAQSATDLPILVLDHAPSDFAAWKEAAGDNVLVLSGHTHDGQIFPGTVVTRLLAKNSYGLKDFDGVQSLVTEGVGYYGPPIRVGTDSEVMVIHLKY